MYVANTGNVHLGNVGNVGNVYVGNAAAGDVDIM